MPCWRYSNSLEGGLSDVLHHIPWTSLLLIVVAMALVAMVLGLVLAWREPGAISMRPWSRAHNRRHDGAPKTDAETWKRRKPFFGEEQWDGVL